MRGRRASVAAVALCLLCACTSSEHPSLTRPTATGATTLPSTQRSPSQTPPTTAPPTTPTSPQTSSSPPATHTQPLAMAVSMHRPPLQLTAAEARAVVAGKLTRWSQLGQPGGRIAVHRGRSGLAAVATRDDAMAVLPASQVTPLVQVATVAGIDPLRQPRRYPLTAPARTAQPVVTTVTVVGDIMLDRGVAAVSPDDPAAALEPMQRRLARADLTIGNLESTLSMAGAPRQPSDDSFAADPAVLAGLAAAGFDLLSLGNNHTGDYGETALLQTLQRIDDSPIAKVGAGRSARAAWRPVVLRHEGVSFGFLAFNAIGETPRATADSPGAAAIRMQPRTGPLNAGDLSRMTRSIGRLAQRVDVVMVLPHWGAQYVHQPVPAQRTVGAALIDAGADLVVGGHPHVVQGVQLHDRRLVVHSLGNFIFDMDFYVRTQEGVVLELVFWDGVLRGARFAPYVIGADFAPRLVDGPRARAILADIWANSDGPLSR